MFKKKTKNYGEEVSEKIDCILKELQNDREMYDQETKRQLKEIQDSDWSVCKYLREILWELKYAGRMRRRP